MSLLLVVMLPFLGAVLPALLIRSGRNACAVSTASINVLSLALLLTHAPAVLRGETLTASWDWVPQAGLSASFFIDGLGLLFAGMILSIGLLVVIYARFYLSKSDPMGNFYAYLLLFQGAMVGVVLSNNVLLMLVFWELTSISSFLLIGFWSGTAAGRQGARMALTVTATGGLSLLGGFLLLGWAGGSYELTELLGQGDLIRESAFYLPIVLLVLGGCFTKSAQFPFHFWLPHAMAAPTPVSAYLHSATMVKAGIFLMARLWPLLSGTDLWFYLVTTTGLVTMVFAAKVALFKDDLKGLLAYSTISHLGLMTMLLGMNSAAAVVVCVFHIINHAAFKAALFMNAGIIDHEAGTRDIQRLGGLRKLMPITATLAIVAAASMCGLPPLGGFLSKEMMLEEVSHTSWAGNPWLLPVLATIGATFSVGYSLRYVFHVFFGPVRDDYPHAPHDPPEGLWMPSALLVVLAVLLGLFPEAWSGAIVKASAMAILQTNPPEFHPVLWHGWTPAVTMSIIAIGVGSLLLLSYSLVRKFWDAVPKPEAKPLFEGGLDTLVAGTRLFSERVHNGSLQRILFLLILAATGFATATFFGSRHDWGTNPMLRVSPVVLIGWFILVGCCGLVVGVFRTRLLALITVNVIGLVSSLAFVILSAPDLALTQISVEVVTLILMLLALYFLPKESHGHSTRFRLGRDAALSIIVGCGVGGLAWAMMTRDFNSISHYFIEQAIPGSGGANVVNVILVDFRGFDTFGEIMVLGIAAMSIYALLDGMLRGKLMKNLVRWTPDGSVSPSRHPLMMVVVTRFMLPLSLMVAVFVFLRGHNLPGGGFIAALIVSIALVMQYMASGYGWAAQQVKVDYHALIGGGALIAAATGIGAMVVDFPFLTSGHDHFDLPIIGEIELSSAIAFDLGVFLTVVGGVMLALANFSGLGREASRVRVNQTPMDFDPAEVPARPSSTVLGSAAPDATGTVVGNHEAISEDATGKAAADHVSDHHSGPQEN